jgi:hypothetical protein
MMQEHIRLTMGRLKPVSGRRELGLLSLGNLT